MKKLLLSCFFLIFIFSNLNANEIDLNDPYYKIGWKNLENPENTSIIIPDANASIEIIETEIYLDSKENIKKRTNLESSHPPIKPLKTGPIVKKEEVLIDPSGMPNFITQSFEERQK